MEVIKLSNSKLLISFNAPLNDQDSETQTYGCRQHNPNICGNNMPNICAFVREDGICKKPSRSWKRQYNTLKSKNI